MQQSSAGNPGELKRSDFPLPNYLRRQPDGIFVDLSIFPVGGGFEQLIDRLFGEGARFVGLDYALLAGLLYDYDAVLDAYGISAKVKLAEDVVDFSVKRKALYKALKVDAEYRYAEYFFEPVEIEVVSEEPVYGEPGADGVAPIVGSARKSELKPTRLDLDEFIADMWLKGVRFGIAVDAVAGVISRRETVRMNIAAQRDATEGSDAEIEEASPVLHRDNSPKILANGKADLRKFQNRFPQIELGARLLKKKPRVLGKPGHKVNGQIIEPEMPKDIDLQALAGAGTRVERQGAHEFIVASRDGFLSLDVDNNHISITEKIENKGGISVKTTGDLSLSGNEFIEHGEVQEGRSVEGKNMTFCADVYGNIVSQNGLILLEGNLSNGSAKSYGGDVTANGRAFNSVLEAWEGTVTVKYAESCLLLGASVVAERAVNCEIVAENIQIGSAEGCSIAGKNVQIKSSNSCRGKDTMVSMVVPDLSILDAQIGQVDKSIGDCQKIIEAKERGMELIKSDAEVAKYLSLATSIRQGSVKLNAAQQENWNKMTARFAKTHSAVEKLAAENQEQLKRMQALQQERGYLLEAREKNGKGIRCDIAEVVGDTLVRTMGVYNGIPAFHKSKPSELKTKLREPGSQGRVFADSEGSLSWRYALPEIAPSPEQSA